MKLTKEEAKEEEIEFYKQWLAFVCSAYSKTESNLMSNKKYFNTYCECFAKVQGTINNFFIKRMADELDKKELTKLANKYQSKIYDRMQNKYLKKIKEKN